MQWFECLPNPYVGNLISSAAVQRGETGELSSAFTNEWTVSAWQWVSFAVVGFWYRDESTSSQALLPFHLLPGRDADRKPSPDVSLPTSHFTGARAASLSSE